MLVRWQGAPADKREHDHMQPTARYSTRLMELQSSAAPPQSRFWPSELESPDRNCPENTLASREAASRATSTPGEVVMRRDVVHLHEPAAHTAYGVEAHLARRATAAQRAPNCPKRRHLSKWAAHGVTTSHIQLPTQIYSLPSPTIKRAILLPLYTRAAAKPIFGLTSPAAQPLPNAPPTAPNDAT